MKMYSLYVIMTMNILILVTHHLLLKKLKSYRHHPQYKSSNIPPVFRSVPRRVEASPPPSIKAALEKVKQYERLSTQRKTNKGTNIDASQRKQNSRRSGRERSTISFFIKILLT